MLSAFFSHFQHFVLIFQDLYISLAKSDINVRILNISFLIEETKPKKFPTFRHTYDVHFLECWILDGILLIHAIFFFTSLEFSSVPVSHWTTFLICRVVWFVCFWCK